MWHNKVMALVLLLVSMLVLTACGQGRAPLEADRHAMGDPDAAVTLTAFDDYQ